MHPVHGMRKKLSEGCALIYASCLGMVSDKFGSDATSLYSRGLPDITLLEPIAEVFKISVTELISGNTIHNENVSANMLRS